MAEFITPEFLQNRSTAQIFQKMREHMPSDIDISQGSHGYNMTYPTAIVAAEMYQFILPECLKIIFPEYSYGSYLNDHAKTRRMARRAATPATGVITITGEPKSIIPVGSLFSTPSVNDEPSIDYETLTAAEIPESGTVDVEIQCTLLGTVGNTAENTIVLMTSKLDGISGVINNEPLTGGTEEESDESLIERIMEYDKSLDDNFTGCPADYKRWAMSVDGVGSATIVPAQDQSGLVTIILTDSNGEPANEQLREKVYNYIVRPDNPGERLTNVNAHLNVIAPETFAIGIQAVVELTHGHTIESITPVFLKLLAEYLPEAMEDKEVKYTKVHSRLSGTVGVNDFKDLKIGVVTNEGISYSTSNISIAINQLPTISAENLILTTGNVE